MKRHNLSLATALVLALMTSVSGASEGHRNRISAKLSSTSEVPAVSSVAHGSFSAVIDEVNQTISYELTYDGLEGTVAQAHIHLGQRSVNGGVSVFLCGNAPTAPPSNRTATPRMPHDVTRDHHRRPNARQHHWTGCPRGGRDVCNHQRVCRTG